MDSVALKNLYEAQGYVTIPGALTEADIDPLKNCVKRLTDDFAQQLQSEGKITANYKDESFDKRIVSILAESGAPVRNWTNHFLGRELFDLVQCSSIVETLAPLLGPDFMFTGGYQLRAKQPTRYHDRLTVFPWHQDTQYYGMHTQHLHIVTVWIPLADVNEQNGCLWFIPGSHKWGAFEGERDVEKNMRSFVDVEKRGTPTPVPMKVGDVVLFHNLAFHSSKQNHTPLARWNVDIRFSSTPGMRPVSKEEEEASEILSQKMAQMGKPSMPVRGHGTGVSFEEWR